MLERLHAQVVFTSLALFSVLIAPLNSFPWVVNGCVEAFVSVRRLQRSALPYAMPLLCMLLFSKAL